jgi:hypothetical protein
MKPDVAATKIFARWKWATFGVDCSTLTASRKFINLTSGESSLQSLYPTLLNLSPSATKIFLVIKERSEYKLQFAKYASAESLSDKINLNFARSLTVLLRSRFANWNLYSERQTLRCADEFYAVQSNFMLCRWIVRCAEQFTQCASELYVVQTNLRHFSINCTSCRWIVRCAEPILRCAK